MAVSIVATFIPPFTISAFHFRPLLIVPSFHKSVVLICRGTGRTVVEFVLIVPVCEKNVISLAVQPDCIASKAKKPSSIAITNAQNTFSFLLIIVLLNTLSLRIFSLKASLSTIQKGNPRFFVP